MRGKLPLNKLIIYCAGGMGKCNYLYLRDEAFSHGYDVIAFADDTANGQFDGTPIISLENIKDYAFDYVAIALYVQEKKECALAKLKKYVEGCKISSLL